MPIRRRSQRVPNSCLCPSINWCWSNRFPLRRMRQLFLRMRFPFPPALCAVCGSPHKVSLYHLSLGLFRVLRRMPAPIYGLAPKPTGRKGRPAKHGRRLSIWDDFVLSDEKTGDYYTGIRRVLTNIFGAREVLAYITSAGKDSSSRRLFFSTVFPEQLHVFRAWQEKVPLNQTGSRWMQYIPLFLYTFRWNFEVNYYEQKTFWSLYNYMVRSCKGIEMLVNLINIAYCAMKLLPYQDETRRVCLFSEIRRE